MKFALNSEWKILHQLRSKKKHCIKTCKNYFRTGVCYACIKGQHSFTAFAAGHTTTTNPVTSSEISFVTSGETQPLTSGTCTLFKWHYLVQVINIAVACWCFHRNMASRFLVLPLIPFCLQIWCQTLVSKETSLDIIFISTFFFFLFGFPAFCLVKLDWLKELFAYLDSSSQKLSV